MLTWATAQLYQMVTDAEATSTTYIGSLDATARQSQTCADVIAARHWQARARLAAAHEHRKRAAIRIGCGRERAAGKLKNLAAAASAFYADTPDLMAKTIATTSTANVAAEHQPRVCNALEENRAYIVHVRDGPR
jgi:hypothetical protein